MKHMGQDERNRIEFMLGCGNNVADIAKALGCIVPDNGTEFSDPEMVENYRPDPEHNPYKLMPRGVRVFYCDPYCSCQKQPQVQIRHRAAGALYQNSGGECRTERHATTRFVGCSVRHVARRARLPETKPHIDRQTSSTESYPAL